MSSQKNKENGFVSIGVPVYNGEEFLHDALKSIQDQTYKNWECHIVNNCSTDKTREIAEEYVKNDNRFILHNYEEHLPLVKNWNRIVNHISPEAEYLKIVQADDLIYPEYLEEMIKVMEKYPSVGMTSSYRIDGKEIKCDGLDPMKGSFYNGKALLLQHLKEEVDISGSITTLLFRTKFLPQVPGYPKIFVENDLHCDTLLSFHFMNIADVGFVFKVLSFTRWHENAYTSRFNVRYNTFYNSKENRLFTFKHLDPSLEKDYRWHRRRYAYMILEHKLKGFKESVKWHRDYTKRKFTFSEYFTAIITLNIITRQFGKILRRLGFKTNF
ncbi:MAG: glycosyltransferase family 2 protein [Bacteroidales bacterium]|nr:glycosyltransferase family 2 protein [Bacteroidales bacterium]